MSRNTLYIIVCMLFVACSTTKNIPEDDQLFVGLKKIQYINDDSNGSDNYADHELAMKEEVEAALAIAPNGALFGSSYYRTPFAPSLWIWNAFSGKDSGFARWMTSSFGKPPVLMTTVNPDLRSSVAQSILQKHGYFHGSVGYDVVKKRNPKKAKIAYRIDMGHLFTIDSLQYLGFPAEADTMIRETIDEALLHPGDPFSVSALDAERNRLTMLFRNNGYYFYQPNFASYLADTLAVPGKVQLRLQMANDVPDVAKHKWYIGHVNINMRKQARDAYTDSVVRRSLTIRYSGKKQPLRSRVILGAMKLRPRQAYSYDNYLESVAKLNAMGLFSSVDVQFAPRDKDTLDMTLNCTFEKPYDFYVETNFKARNIGRVGPELKLGLTRRNAFHGGEKIDINLHGSYEWSTSGGTSMSNYDYGADLQVEFPRIIAPFFGNNSTRRDSQGRRVRRYRFYSTPTTLAKVSADIIRRPGYYKMHVNSGEWTYRWRTSENSTHEFSPLIVKYQYMNSKTEEYLQFMIDHPYLMAAMEDYCIPEMRYTYIYTSPKSYLNPIRWEFKISESGNLTSLGFMALGKGKWNELEKTLFKTPYSQFVKLETEFSKIWSFGMNSELVGHVSAGVLTCFGNSCVAPTTELFYVGGANSVRAFRVRSIGPGPFDLGEGRDHQMSYLFQNGDLKLVFNLEYRRKLFGKLHGALFLDAGNVWKLSLKAGADEVTNILYEAIYKDCRFDFSTFLDHLALGTGVGLRYNLGFLVLRLDWGIGLHVPYSTGRSGYFNARSFTRDQTLHFAVGYPF